MLHHEYNVKKHGDDTQTKLDDVQVALKYVQ